MKILKVVSILDKRIGGGCAERVSQLSRIFSDNHDIVSIATLNIGVIDTLYYSKNKIKLNLINAMSKRFLIPYFFSISKYRDYDLFYLYSHWSFLNAIFFFIGRFYGIPIIYCPVGTSIIFGRSLLLKFFYNKIIGKTIIKKSQAVIAVNDDERNFIKLFYNYKGPIYVIPNGVDEDAFKFSGSRLFRSKYLHDNSPYIIFMGRLNYIKGPDLLLEAFIGISNKYPNYLLALVGPDEGMKMQLVAIAKSKNILNRIIFTGYIDGDEKRSALYGASLLVIPSRKEAMSIVVLEAGAQKCPVLITENCGFLEAEEHEGGFVVPADVMMIRSAMDKMLSDKVLLNETSSRLHKLVFEKYTWKRIAYKLFEINKEVRYGRNQSN